MANFAGRFRQCGKRNEIPEPIGNEIATRGLGLVGRDDLGSHGAPRRRCGWCTRAPDCVRSSCRKYGSLGSRASRPRGRRSTCACAGWKPAIPGDRQSRGARATRMKIMRNQARACGLGGVLGRARSSVPEGGGCRLGRARLGYATESDRWPSCNRSTVMTEPPRPTRRRVRVALGEHLD